MLIMERLNTLRRARCELYYHLMDQKKCLRESCLGCKELDSCQVIRAQYERKKSIQVDRYEEAKELGQRAETKLLTLSELESYAIKLKEQWFVGGRIDIQKLRAALADAFGFRVSQNKAYHLKSALERALATSILFTPMPIFISNITQTAALPTSIVFAVFILNSCGEVAGYLVAGTRSNQLTAKANISRTVIIRSLLAFLLIAVSHIPSYAIILATTILILMGFVNSIFQIYTLSLSMEILPAGKAGLFNVLVGIGGACGSFIGLFIAQTFGFLHVFIAAGITFSSAYVAFKIFI
jgi:hypothetical protein